VTVVGRDVAVVAVLGGVRVEVSLGLLGNLHWVLSGHCDVIEGVVCVVRYVIDALKRFEYEKLSFRM